MDELTPQHEEETGQVVRDIQPNGNLSGDEKYVQVGRSADYAFGVLYQAEYETEWDGTAVAARLHARALAKNLPVLLRSFSLKFVDENGSVQDASQGLPDAVEKEVGHLRRTSIRNLTPLIKHCVVRDADHLKQMVWPRGANAGFDAQETMRIRDRVYAQHILFSVWERNVIDERIARQLASFGECWVPCEQNADLLRSSGVERVHVIHHPFDPADPICRLVGRQPRADDWRLFYSIGRWEPRKGYDRLLEAFLLAFTPVDHAKLTLKITGQSWPDYPTPRELVAKLLEDDTIRARGWNAETFAQRVTVVEGRKPRSEIIALHYYNNIYVSASHGEAFSVPAFEAKLAGNSLVHVPFGGTADFADADTDVAVDGIEMVPVHASYNWEPGAQWAGYSTGSLVTALRTVQAPSHYRVSPKLDDYTLTKIGCQMRDRVIAVCESFAPKAHRFYRGEPEPEPETAEPPTEENASERTP